MNTILQKIYFFHIPVDGNWGEWGNWTECSKTCIGGMQNRTRTCSDPIPQYGGFNCTDSNATTVSGDGMTEIEVTTCNDITCNTDICKTKFAFSTTSLL